MNRFAASPLKTGVGAIGRAMTVTSSPRDYRPLDLIGYILMQSENEKQGLSK
jgi:hypothetical protein